MKEKVFMRTENLWLWLIMVIAIHHWLVNNYEQQEATFSFWERHKNVLFAPPRPGTWRAFTDDENSWTLSRNASDWHIVLWLLFSHLWFGVLNGWRTVVLGSFWPTQCTWWTRHTRAIVMTCGDCCCCIMTKLLLCFRIVTLLIDVFTCTYWFKANML